MTKDKFPVMLASPMKEIERIKFPCVAQTKMDGMRAVIIKRNGHTKVYSRNGNEMIKLGKHFEEIIKYTDNVVLDGELTVLDEVFCDTLDRKAGNGICHKAVESVATISDEEVGRVRVTLWDWIPLKDWENQICTISYEERYVELARLPKTKLHGLVDSWVVDNLNQAHILFKRLVEEGNEGIVLKNINHPWENKRSKHIVKMKEMQEMDLKIIGMVEGQGKNSGMMGAINCENRDGSIKVDVGTGFTDEQRIHIWNNKDKLIGTILTVKHNGIIDRKGSDTKSLFLPVFIELRPDKEIAD